MTALRLLSAVSLLCVILTAQQTTNSGVRVVQGRITQIRNGMITLKTPNGGPGNSPGLHAKFIVAGATLTIDISHANVFQADGQTPDATPLTAGDRVLVLFTPLASDPTTLSASIVERLALGDTVATH